MGSVLSVGLANLAMPLIANAVAVKWLSSSGGLLVAGEAVALSDVSGGAFLDQRDGSLHGHATRGVLGRD